MKENMVPSKKVLNVVFNIYNFLILIGTFQIRDYEKKIQKYFIYNK